MAPKTQILWKPSFQDLVDWTSTAEAANRKWAEWLWVIPHIHFPPSLQWAGAPFANVVVVVPMPSKRGECVQQTAVEKRSVWGKYGGGKIGFTFWVQSERSTIKSKPSFGSARKRRRRAETVYFELFWLNFEAPHTHFATHHFIHLNWKEDENFLFSKKRKTLKLFLKIIIDWKPFSPKRGKLLNFPQNVID